MNAHHAEVVFTDTPLTYETDPIAATERLVFTYERIGIDEVRALIMEAHRRPKAGHTAKEIVVRSLKITREAEQASLKILEEPPVGIRIVLVLPVGTQLLPTVLSRVLVTTTTSTTSSGSFSDWVDLQHADRLKEVETRIKAKDVEWLQTMKTELQEYIRSGRLNGKLLSETQLVLDNFMTRGASNKMLLEHLALTLPLTRSE